MRAIRVSTIRLSVALLCNAVIVAACSPEAIAGLLAPVAEGTSSTAQLTIWTSDPSPSPIEITVDGEIVGTLTAYRNAAPTCGAPSSSGVLTISRPGGAHVITARETRDSGYWPATTIQL